MVNTANLKLQIFQFCKGACVDFLFFLFTWTAETQWLSTSSSTTQKTEGAVFYTYQSKMEGYNGWRMFVGRSYALDALK